MRPYDHTKLEKKWQKEWTKRKLYQTPDAAKGKDNFYLLVEFPYPSGNLHVGHWYAFAVPDILARFKRMQGNNVLYPIGFDAFGLPAENAAIKNKLNPRTWTQKNIAYMKKQIESMGASFDWSREVVTCDPAYYKWTQWLFLQFFKEGLAYRKETAVNWCPKDKTVLANEQVVDGKCERCDTEVVQKQMLQWNIKITDYADRLIDDLEPLDWPKEIKESQRNWIGRSEGAEIDFPIAGSDERVTVFTTRPDTLFGGTYLVLAPEHPWVTLALQQGTVLSNNDAVRAYVEQAKRKTELERQTEQKEKTGVELKGVMAINPAIGKEIPLWVADFVIGSYGTGAVFADAHDERDWEFARKYGIPLKETLEPLMVQRTGPDAFREEGTILERRAVLAITKHWSEDKYLCLEFKASGVRGFPGGGVESGEDIVVAAQREIQEETGYANASFVRQLGGPIHSKFFNTTRKQNQFSHHVPLLFELKNDIREKISEEQIMPKVHWVEEDKVADFINRDDFNIAWNRVAGDVCFAGKGILFDSGEFSGLTSDDAIPQIGAKFGRMVRQYRLRDWIVSRQRYWGVPIPIIHCPSCGAVAVSDKDLPVKLPEVKDYLPDGSGHSPLAKAAKWITVKCPQCKGKAERETDTLDTFVDSSWYFLRYTDPTNKKKFADAKKMAQWMPVDLYSGGAEHTTMHLLYSRFWHKALFDMGLVADPEPYQRRMNHSVILGPDGQKMSKSHGNVIDPDLVVDRFGADTVRMYLAFIGPYNEVASYPWNPNGVVGVRRFLERVWRAQKYTQKSDDPVLENLLHKTIKKVGEDIAALKFNTAISALMIFLKVVEKQKTLGNGQWERFLKLLAPFAPHMAEELWAQRGHKRSVHQAPWPEFDESRLKDERLKIAVQINGKTRGETNIAGDADKTATESAAREVVASRLEGKIVVRTIVVPGRLVNFVVEE
jgi:leucyl-tRNA synthetase